ncbi:PEP-CTERM sorting domain-containing protein [Nitrosospira multiformis]|uniref:PEP-CTERM sorting domain-containing protein n=1 Tax=Nitrosospira multiformis TaxID=1231 RepID=UPI0009BF03EC|nr:PEP-CTERM sorting domain-containing protein [Nitrosospira multiformis]
MGTDISNVESASVGASYISENPLPPIPEPESYALLLAGLSLITFVIRYSPRKQMLI